MSISNDNPIVPTPLSATLANLKLSENWKQLTSGDAYKMLFGDKPYLKVLKDENLRGILNELPEDAVPGLKEKAQNGNLREADIRQLQTVLQSKGYDIGPMGVDGKLGPRTFDALSHFLKGDPPTEQAT